MLIREGECHNETRLQKWFSLKLAADSTQPDSTAPELPSLQWDPAAVVESVGGAASRNLRAVPTNIDFLKLSAKTGEGMAGYTGSLERWRTISHTSAAVSK
jgi:hypothetical protein